MISEAILLFLLLKGSYHEKASQPQILILEKALLCNRRPNPPEERPGRNHDHAGRHSPVSDAVLLPAPRLQSLEHDEERETENCVR